MQKWGVFNKMMTKKVQVWHELRRGERRRKISYLINSWSEEKKVNQVKSPKKFENSRNVYLVFSGRVKKKSRGKKFRTPIKYLLHFSPFPPSLIISFRFSSSFFVVLVLKKSAEKRKSFLLKKEGRFIFPIGMCIEILHLIKID